MEEKVFSRTRGNMGEAQRKMGWRQSPAGGRIRVGFLEGGAEMEREAGAPSAGADELCEVNPWSSPLISS